MYMYWVIKHHDMMSMEPDIYQLTCSFIGDATYI